MHLTFIAVGSRGDVEPLIALAHGMRAAGHDIRFVSHEEFAPRIEQQDLEFWEARGLDPREAMRSPEGLTMQGSGRNPVAYARSFARLLEPFMADVFTSSLEAARDADALVFSAAAFSGYPVAKRLGKRGVLALLQPLLPTRAFPSPLLPVPHGIPGRIARLSHHLVEQVLWQSIRRPMNRALGSALALDPLDWHGPFTRMIAEGTTALCGFSRLVVPRPADWPDTVEVCGYWPLDPPAWTPRGALEVFLAGGEPPVFIGFGSMTPKDPEALTEVLVGALERVGRRGVLQGGWGGLGGGALPDSVLVVDDLPHAWLFEHVAAVVHHGGAGTTGAALRAGRPSIALPLFGDQFFWGRRIEALGAGPRPIPIRRVTTDGLVDALGTLTHERTRERAGELGARLREERGVEHGVRTLERRLGGTATFGSAAL